MKLKPVTLVSTKYPGGKENLNQQVLLLNALKTTQDPEKLRQMIGVKTVAEVFKTLDKLSLRKEYQKALADSGVDFDFIVRGIKAECLAGEKSSDRLKGYQILLKSLGQDSYEDTKGDGGSGWEDALQKVIKEKEKSSKKAIKAPVVELEDYEVVEPELPNSVRERKTAESVGKGKDLYD
jgi:hypothetical protein